MLFDANCVFYYIDIELKSFVAFSVEFRSSNMKRQLKEYDCYLQ